MRKRKNEVFTAEERSLAEKIAALPPSTKEEVQRIRQITRARSAYGGLLQIIRAAPQPDLEEEIIAQYAMFLENDGIEFALTKLLIAAANAGMDCYSRANTDIPKVRDFEARSGCEALNNGCRVSQGARSA